MLPILRQPSRHSLRLGGMPFFCCRTAMRAPANNSGTPQGKLCRKAALSSAARTFGAPPPAAEDKSYPQAQPQANSILHTECHPIMIPATLQSRAAAASRQRRPAIRSSLIHAPSAGCRPNIDTSFHIFLFLKKKNEWNPYRQLLVCDTDPRLAARRHDAVCPRAVVCCSPTAAGRKQA